MPAARRIDPAQRLRSAAVDARDEPGHRAPAATPSRATAPALAGSMGTAAGQVHHQVDQVDAAVDAIGALDVIAAAAAVLAQHPDEAVRLVGEYLHDGAQGNLVEYLGAESRRGYSVRLELVLARRDAVLVKAAELAFAGLPIAEQARALSRGLRSYASTAWPRDRLKHADPYPADSLKALLFEVLRLRDRPLGAVQIGRVIRSDHLSRKPA